MTKGDHSIYVDNELFLGRLDEQEQFREVLNTVIENRDDKAPPFIFLIYGEAGLGKSQLTRRLYDIATVEAPFAQNFQVLRLDWALVRHNKPALRVPRAQIQPEDVLAALYQQAQDHGWGEQFDVYQNLLEQRQTAERAVANALEQEYGQFVALRDLGTSVLAGLVRLALPVGQMAGRRQQALRAAGIQLEVETAIQLRQQADRFLRTYLKPNLYDVYRQPHEQLAWALGQGWRQVSRDRPLALILDSYEIVAPTTDIWIRTVIKSAGPNVVWVIAGQDNLAATRPGSRHVGYSAEFLRRLIVWDIQPLPIKYVSPCLIERAPNRPPTPKEIAAIHHTTLGVPLALRQAADLWAQGVDLAAITEGRPDYALHEQFIRQMCQRIMQHVERQAADPFDRQALYALAMQPRSDPQIQAAILQSAEAPFDLERRLVELAGRYSVVRLADGAWLHEAASAFFAEQLMQTEASLNGLAQSMAEAAVKLLRARRAELTQNLPTLPERLGSEAWRQASLDLVHWLFWQDEWLAWRELIPRLVEGLGYDPDFARSLVKVADRFSSRLGAEGRERLNHLLGLNGASPGQSRRSEGRPASNNLGPMLAELTRLAQKGHWLDDEEAGATAERQAILALWQGHWLVEQGQYGQALQSYLAAEEQAPARTEPLKAQLAQAFSRVAWRLGWSRGVVIASPEAELAFGKAIALDESRASYWIGLGIIKYGLGKQGEAIETLCKGVELDSKHGYARYWLGRIYHDLAQYEEAIAAYQQAIQLDPKFSAPRVGLGNLYRDLARYDEAITVYQRALEFDPNQADFHYGLGAVYSDLARYDEAIAAYQQAIRLDPGDAYSYNGLAQIYQEQRQYDEALATYQHALKLDPDFTAPYTGLGNIYRVLARYDEAIAAYEQAIQLDPNDPYPYNGLGNVYYDLAYYDAAISLYQQAMQLDPNYAYPHYGLGHVYREIGRYDEAIAAYQQAIKLDPDDPYPQHELGNLYRELGSYDEAIAAYQQAIKLDPDDAAPHNELGHVYRELGRYDEAVASYQQAVKLDPTLTPSHNILGNLYRELGRYDEAVAAYRQALRLDPNLTAAYNGLGNVYRQLGRYDEAIAAYQQAIRLDPKDADFHYGLGNVYSELGQDDEAIAAYQQAIRLDPNDAYPYTGLGNLYHELARYDEAVTAYQRAIRLDPDSADAHNGLGLAYMILGQADPALAALQRAVELDPDNASFRISLATMLQRAGRRAGALEHLAQARNLLPDDEYYDRACLETLVGNIEVALDYLEKALAQAPEERAWASRDPDLEPLRGQQRFEALVGNEE
jgi:tetratricopeptide (TPR) repeat protein